MIQADLKDMQTKKVSEHELHQAKLMLLRDVPLAEASVDSIASGWLSRSGLGLPLDEPVRAGKIYIQLDAKDVKSAYAKWLRSDGLVQVTQGPVPH
jgi:zinc protease